MSFRSTSIPLQEIGAVASRFSTQPLSLGGFAEFDGHFESGLTPESFRARGQAKLVNASFAATAIGNTDLQWSATMAEAELVSQSPDFLGGNYRLSAHMRDLDWTHAIVRGKIDNIQIPRIVAMAGLELPSSGILRGSIEVTQVGDLPSLKLHGELATRGVTLLRIPCEIAEANLVVANGLADITSRGTACGGNYELAAQGHLAGLQQHFAQPDTQLHLLPIGWQASISNFSVSKLMEALRIPRSVVPIQAVIQGSCLRNQASLDSGMVCQITGAVERLSWNRMQFSDRISAQLDVRSERINLNDVSGRFADGRITGNAEVILSNPPRGVFDFEIAQINLRRAAMPLGSVGKGISGTASVAVMGRLGETISGKLNLQADHAVASDLMIQKASMPIDWSFAQRSQTVKWRCRNGMVEAGKGKVYFSCDGDYSRGLNTQVSARIERLDSSKLIRGKSFGAGLVSGTVNLKAQRATQLQQVSGDFDIQLAQIEAMEMPVLDQLPSMIQLPSITSTTATQENGGRFQGRLANGVVYLDDATLSQSNVHVLMEGRSTLEGNLNFDVTASTYQSGPVDDLLALADSPLMMAGPAPIALLAKANEAMKNRVVHVQVTGTAARPILRLQPGKQLSQEALRFFIRSSLPTQLADVAEQNTLNRRR